LSVYLVSVGVGGFAEGIYEKIRRLLLKRINYE